MATPIQMATFIEVFEEHPWLFALFVAIAVVLILFLILFVPPLIEWFQRYVNTTLSH